MESLLAHKGSSYTIVAAAKLEPEICYVRALVRGVFKVHSIVLCKIQYSDLPACTQKQSTMFWTYEQQSTGMFSLKIVWKYEQQSMFSL